MFKQLHNKKTQKRIWIVLAILIIFTFLFWGSGSIIRSQMGANFAGKIGNRRISLLEYQNALKAARNQALILWGDNFYKLEEQMGLESQAWDRLLLLDEAERRKIKVNDLEVTELIQSYPFFQKNSKFDLYTYEQLLKFIFYSPARVFEEQTRDNLKIRKLYEMLTYDIKLTDGEIRNEYRKENEEARVEYISAIPTEFLDNTQIEEKEIKEYFDNNTLEFKRPDTFNLQYLQILYPQDAKEPEINAIDEKAKFIFSKLRKEKDILKFAKESSLEIKETGVFSLNDPIPGIGWSPEIVGVVLKLKMNKFGLPIRTEKGWYLIKLKEKRDTYIPTFEEVKEQAREKVMRIKSREFAQQKLEACLKKINDMYKINPSSIDFKKLAKEFHLKFGETEFFKRASYIHGIGISDNFFYVISNMKVGQISNILATEQGFYIIRLKDLKVVDEEQYLKEKEDFSKRFIALKKETAFVKFLERLRKEANLKVSISKAKPLFEYK